MILFLLLEVSSNMWYLTGFHLFRLKNILWSCLENAKNLGEKVSLKIMSVLKMNTLSSLNQELSFLISSGEYLDILVNF